MHNQQTSCLTAHLAPESSAIPQPGAVSETYLQDESKMRGAADAILRPDSTAALAAILKKAKETKTHVTVSGARTGITGGAVPNGGWLVSLEKMSGFYGMRHDPANDMFFLSCGPGTTLDEIHAALEHPANIATGNWTAESLDALEKLKKSGPHIFPPDPTERSATIGGMAACNASGARSFFYGPTRNYISGLKIALAGGFVLDIRRNRFFADKHGSFTLALPGSPPEHARLPNYAMPATKNTAGYFAKPEMDLIDLFIGSEGTLGIFAEIEINLVKAPENIISVIAFFNSEPDAFRFIHAARGDSTEKNLPSLKPLSLEYFDSNSLNLLREQKEKTGDSSGIPALNPEWVAAVSVELNSSEAKMEDDAESLLSLLEACGSDPDSAWTALDERETERLKTFRHALPEAVNQRIGERSAQHPGISKLGTDIAVPDASLDSMIQRYRAALDEAQLEYVMFGHIGNSHPHVNILPRTIDEHEKGREIYIRLAEQAVALGGSVSGEHGIGKLKKNMLKIMYSTESIDEMRRLKKVFDPEFILNRGNVFDET